MFSKIMVPIDPAEPAFSQEALSKAAQLARDYAGKLHLVAICAEVQRFVASQLPEGFQDKEITETRGMLNRLAESLDLPAGDVSTEVRVGPVDNEVLDAAKQNGADLIVMASHKPGLSTYFVGSHGAHVVRHAPCSVMVLRET
ncbi:universal stress protein [Roseibium aquae]|uniref:Universal stress protein n=1 Tax=Roseibium aquae TaxID=1323746 RepID=A0A916WVH1_9HYPH|nr:universal stress protein [Roseibium aquae]GGB37209.1 universal stress protein [Roseibium aquae]